MTDSQTAPSQPEPDTTFTGKNITTPFGIVTAPALSRRMCDHCFCGELIYNGKPHLVCCMCGTRKLRTGVNA